MAQLTVYIDEQTLDKIERMAKIERCSISRWVKERLELSLAQSWPKDYFRLHGSLSERDLKRPKQPKLSADSKREKL